MRAVAVISCGSGEAGHLHVIGLRFAIGAAAVPDEFFEEGLHFCDFGWLGAGEVGGFGEVAVEMVELDGLGGVGPLAPAAGSLGSDVFPWAEAEGGDAAAGGADGVGAGGLGLALEGSEEADAVFAGVIREGGAKEIGEGAEEVGLVDEVRAGGAGGYGTGPADDEGDAVTAFPCV